MISIHVNESKNVNKETPFDGDHGYMENKINYHLNGKSGTPEIVYLCQFALEFCNFSCCPRVWGETADCRASFG